MLRVVLFDLVLDGHHLEYACHISRYLHQQGDAVKLITWASHPQLDQVGEGESLPEIVFLSKQPDRPHRTNVLLRFERTVRGLQQCMAMARDWKADLVHHLYVDRAEVPMLLATLGGQPQSSLFATLFWPYFLPSGQENMVSLRRIYHRASHAALGRLLSTGKLAGLFVHSERIRARLLESYGARPLNQQICVVPDPAPAPRSISQEDARARLSLPLEGEVILFFGGLRWDKGADLLLEALPSLEHPARASEGQWSAVFAGESDRIGQAEIERCRERLREPRRLISRLGFVPNNDVDTYFAAADVVVLPYRKVFKGTSGVLQRAAAAGKPVIATDVGEVGPTVREKGLGIVVNPESVSHLAGALRDFLGRREQVKSEVHPKAIRYARDSNWRVLAKGVRDAYLGRAGEDMK